MGTYCSSSKIYGEVGKLPLKHTIEKRIVGFWIKTSDDKPQKYSTLIYKLLFTLHASEQFHFKWLDNIENILTKCGFKNLFIEQEEYLSKKPFKKLIFKEITKEGQMEWYHNMFINKNCHVYRMIKSNLNFEKYLTMQKLTFSQKDALTKFRCGSNKLLVNKYSFSNDTEDKMCPICDLREVGDEFHYIFICPYLQKEREQYIKKYYRIRPRIKI